MAETDNEYSIRCLWSDILQKGVIRKDIILVWNDKHSQGLTLMLLANKKIEQPSGTGIRNFILKLLQDLHTGLFPSENMINYLSECSKGVKILYRNLRDDSLFRV